MLNLKRNPTALVTRYLKVTTLAAAILVPAIWSQVANAVVGDRIAHMQDRNGGTGCVTRAVADQAHDCSRLQQNFGITTYKEWDCYYDTKGNNYKIQETKRGWFPNGNCCTFLHTPDVSEYPTMTCPNSVREVEGPITRDKDNVDVTSGGDATPSNFGGTAPDEDANVNHAP